MRYTLAIYVWIAFAAVCMLTETGCTGKQATGSDSIADSLISDSLAKDTLAEIVEEEPMPVMADELFDDFFFNYAGSRKVQKERTLFPLTIVTDGKETQIDASAWKRERFFMPQGYYTLIMHKASGMKLVKDTTVNLCVVEKLNIKKGRMTRWHFLRERGAWHMNRITNEPLKNHPDAAFLRFYQRFATDTAFQQHSLAETVTVTGPDPDDDFSTMTGDIMPEQWPMFAPWMPSGVLYNIVYGAAPYPASNIRYFYIRGIANGLQTDMVFERRGKSWVLTKMQN